MCASTLEERLDKTKHIPKTNQKITLFINTDIDINMITLSLEGANVQI